MKLSTILLLPSLLLSYVCQLTSGNSNLTSQTWIDFLLVDKFRLLSYAECITKYSCNVTQEILDSYDQMVTILGLDGDAPTFNQIQTGDDKLCDCDPKTCGRYETCCRDVVEKREIPEKVVPTKCVSQYDSGHDPIYVNMECPSNFTDSTIRTLCETPIDKTTSKPDLEYWFVSSNNTLYTYRNIYCALCNGESTDNLEFWDVDFRCPPLDNSTQSNLTQTYSACFALFSNKKYKDPCLLPNIITTCPPSFNDSAVKEKCERGGYEPISPSGSTWYKNIYCTTCHGIASNLDCRKFPETSVHYTIRILVHPFGQTCSERTFFGEIRDESCSSISASFSSCADGEIYSWTNQMCRSICPAPLQFIGGKCQAVDQSLSQTGNSTDLPTNCLYIPRDEYQQLQTGGGLSYRADSIQLDIWNTSTSYCTRCKWVEYEQIDVTIEDSLRSLTTPDETKYSSRLYIITNMSKVLVCGDPNATNTTDTEGLLGKICIRVEAEKSVSITLMSISIVCLVIMIIVYSILPNLHNVPGYIVLSQVVPLALGYIFFLLRGAVDGNAAGCYITAVIVHYTFLSSYTWSFLFAVEIIFTITSIYAVNQKSWKKLIRYSLVGWSVPLIPVLTAIIVDSVEPQSELAPQYGQPECWFNSSYGLYIYFLIPIAIILLLNFISYVIVVVKFAVLAYQARGIKNSHKEKLILSIKLFFAFGLLWVFGILSAAIPGDPAISCIFVLVNTLSGILLMLVFICNCSVLQGLRKHVSSVTTQSGSSTQLTNNRLRAKGIASGSNSNSSSFDTRKPLHSSKV